MSVVVSGQSRLGGTKNRKKIYINLNFYIMTFVYKVEKYFFCEYLDFNEYLRKTVL